MIVFALSMLSLGSGAASNAASVESAPKFSFQQIWGLVRAHSPAIQASQHEQEAARIKEERLSRHWYPRLFADARAFETNDSALTFMSLLGQRQITSSDFSPDSLNQPGNHFFGRATLGFDFPLYEGGSKVAEHDAAKSAADAKNLESNATLLKNYTDLATTFGSLLVLKEQRQELKKLEVGVNETLSRYKIGSKKNPVGYSGLLGLKNLRNRLSGLLIENDSKAQAGRESITVLASELPKQWLPEEQSFREFIAKQLMMKVSEGAPLSVRTARSESESRAQNKQVEKSKFLPKVGLFAEGNLYDGNRAAATSYTTGAYLQWELFSAPKFGSLGQAEHEAAAAEARADALNESSRIDRSRAATSIVSLNRNIELMDQSLPLISEQTDVARQLFKNGSINALQLVDILERRADLLTNRANAGAALVQAYATLMLNSDTSEVTYVTH